MTRRTRKVVLLVAAATLLVLLPVIGTLTINYNVSLKRSQERLDGLSASVARRVEEVLLTTEAALADVAFDARNGCTVQLVREFRNKTITLPTLAGMAFVSDDGHLVCTTYGMVEPPLEIETPPLIGSPQWLLQFSAPWTGDYIPGQYIAVIYELPKGDQLVAAMEPDTMVDVVPEDALADDGHLVVRIGDLQVAALGPELNMASRFLETREDVGLYGAYVAASANEQWALAPWRESALLSGVIAGAAGLALAFGAGRLGRKRLSLAGELREALDNQEFEIWYQPVICLQSGRCVGAEALIRWRHPEQDLIPPDLFITMAEETGIIIPMTRYLMEEVGVKIGPLLRADRDLHVAVNLAPAHVTSFDIVEDGRKTLELYGIEPQQILFELTERGLIDHPNCHSVIQALSELGTEVAIDDFGTGYSSLAYIDKFKLDYLKIDKAFVSAIGDHSPAARLTDVIIDMAKSLNLKTIAEGVETEQQAKYLRERGVHYAQGWHFSKPLAAEDFVRYVQDSAENPVLAALAADESRNRVSVPSV